MSNFQLCYSPTTYKSLQCKHAGINMHITQYQCAAGVNHKICRNKLAQNLGLILYPTYGEAGAHERTKGAKIMGSWVKIPGYLAVSMPSTTPTHHVKSSSCSVVAWSSRAREALLCEEGLFLTLGFPTLVLLLASMPPHHDEDRYCLHTNMQ